LRSFRRRSGFLPVNFECRKKIGWLILACWILVGPAVVIAGCPAQRQVTDSAIVIDTLVATGIEKEPAADTLILFDPQPYQDDSDSLLISGYRTANTKPVHRRSPTRTMLKSVALPGWGQAANGKYVKAAVIGAIESYFIYRAVDYGLKAGDARRDWKNLPDTLPTQKAAAFLKYADFRDSRNSHIWYTAITVFLSMIDAYVDAHLHNFPLTPGKKEGVHVQVGSADDPSLTLVYAF